MPSPKTRSQIAKLTIDPQAPLLVCDVDEVVVRFIEGLENYLAEQNLWLDPASFALNGNIKSRTNNEPVSSECVGNILTNFFRQKTRSLKPIDGAVETLNQLSKDLQIVMLSNLPHEAYEDRLINMGNIGLTFPLITNEGGKGPAVEELTRSLKAPLFFIDDIPQYLTSVAQSCPKANLIHFAHDQRFAKHAPDVGFKHFKTRSWLRIKDHILNQLLKR